MASYFVARHAQPDGFHAVHDRSRCPPARFPEAACEYLGEFGDSAQAVVVARQVYAQARSCTCCHPVAVPAPAVPRALQPAMTALRS